MFTLDDRIAIVTGAGSGIGRQAALTLAGAGATVVLAARRREKLEQTRALIAADGGQAECMELDVTDAASVERCMADTIESLGVPDVLVNNAGIAAENYVVATDEAEWDAIFATNLKGVFLVARAFAKPLIEAGRPGSVVNIASILGFRNAPTLGTYAAAKAGVVSLTRTMALEWARYGIRVNALAPGYFKTEMNRDVLESERAEKLMRRVPMRRIGELHELAGPLLLLASDAGSFMTGSIVTVDGGQVINSL